jgi:hypothetical protein
VGRYRGRTPADCSMLPRGGRIEHQNRGFLGCPTATLQAIRVLCKPLSRIVICHKRRPTRGQLSERPAHRRVNGNPLHAWNVTCIVRVSSICSGLRRAIPPNSANVISFHLFAPSPRISISSSGKVPRPSPSFGSHTVAGDGYKSGRLSVCQNRYSVPKWPPLL